MKILQPLEFGSCERLKTMKPKKIENKKLFFTAGKKCIETLHSGERERERERERCLARRSCTIKVLFQRII